MTKTHFEVPIQTALQSGACEGITVISSKKSGGHSSSSEITLKIFDAHLDPIIIGTTDSNLDIFLIDINGR